MGVNSFTGSMLTICVIVPVLRGSRVEQSTPTMTSVNMKSPVSKSMAFFVVKTELLIIVNFGIMSSPDCIIIDEHSTGDPIGSLSSSGQFSLASNES